MSYIKHILCPILKGQRAVRYACGFMVVCKWRNIKEWGQEDTLLQEFGHVL